MQHHSVGWSKLFMRWRRAFLLRGWCWVRTIGCNPLCSFLIINKAIQVFLHILVWLMIYAFVWSIYIWSYIVYDSRSMFLDSVMLLWFYRYSLKLGKWGSKWQGSIRRERNQARNQAQDRGWSPLFPSYLLLINGNESGFSLFVSKVATSLSGTSSSV